MSDQLPITHLSGTLRTVQINDVAYNVSHLYCSCVGATVELSPAPFDKPDAPTVQINCQWHGMLSASAVKCGMTFEMPTITNDSVFAAVEGRFRRDRRVQWGMSGGKR